MMKKREELQLKQIERPFIAYPLCFDDVMRTYLENINIPYWHAFGGCWEFCYDPKKPTDEEVSFLSVGYKKYEVLGIEVRKYPADDRNNTVKEIKKLLSEGKIVPLHYDGYYCPWDKMQKKRRWHNRHTVLVRRTDKRGENWIVDDPYYSVKNKKVPISEIGSATKFYFTINTESYREKTSQGRFEEFLPKFTEAPIVAMKEFLADITQKTKNGENIFSAKWIETIENGFMTRHYLWLFFRHLRQETKKTLFGMAELLFFSDLQLWKECVIHSLKGGRKHREKEHEAGFLQTFREIIVNEQKIYSLLHDGKTKGQQELISTSEIGWIKENEAINLHTLFNARACKKGRRDLFAADITGEGEYIIPQRRFLKKIKVKGITFLVDLGARLDHFRCAGQIMTISDSAKWKGIAFLACSEWGCSQFLIKMIGRNKEYLSDCLLNDFTNPEYHSVGIGSSYLGPGKRYQKKIYFQAVYFDFPGEEKICAIEFPDCPSAHVFSAVLLR